MKDGYGSLLQTNFLYMFFLVMQTPGSKWRPFLNKLFIIYMSRKNLKIMDTKEHFQTQFNDL